MPKKIPAGFKDRVVELNSGVMDLRSPPGELGDSNYRISLNMSMNETHRMSRMGGWTKLLSDSIFGFKNQDLHAQLIDCQFYYESFTNSIDAVTFQTGEGFPYWYPGDPGYGYGTQFPIFDTRSAYEYNYCGDYRHTFELGCREAVTMLFEAVSGTGRRVLLAGTASRIYALNDKAANWRILADRLGGAYTDDNNCGCPRTRFKPTQAGDIVLFTNARDPVLFWNMGSGPHGCNLWSVEYVLELLALNITSASTIVHWRGFVFLADVTRDGTRRGSEIFWSDFNAPTSWFPGGESLAGFTDLGKGEKVTAMEPLGGQLRIYTSRGNEKAIYEVALVGGDEQFNFRELYRGPDGLEYQNSIINTGKDHIYVGESDIYVLSEYDRAPRRLEWLHKASGAIFRGISGSWLKEFPGLIGQASVNKDACEQVVGGYDSSRKSAIFSWPTGSDECPTISLAMFLDFEKATIVDHGFTAFVNHRPDFYTSLRDWLVEIGVCSPDAFLTPKEGAPYDLAEGEFDPPAYILNPTEDPELPSHADSVCARVAGQDLFDFCQTCDTDTIFVMADAHDKTLKQFAPDSYYRERFVGEVSPGAYDCPETAPGSYALDGYYSMLQGECYNFGTESQKFINRLSLEFEAEVQTTPNNLYAQIAYGQQSNCMLWNDRESKELTCLTDKSDEEHYDDETMPGRIARFPFYRKGKYISWRFYVDGTGGGSSFGKLTMSVRLAETDSR